MSKPVCQEIFVLVPVATGGHIGIHGQLREGVGFASCYLCLIETQRSITMAGTLAQARVQLQNAESSILFMQQEHAKTLQGLYAEISKLQKKCGGMDCCHRENLRPISS